MTQGRLLKLSRAVFLPLWFSLLPSSSPDLLSFFTLCPKYVSRISLSGGVSAEIWIRLETETQMKFCKNIQITPKGRERLHKNPHPYRIAVSLFLGTSAKCKEKAISLHRVPTRTLSQLPIQETPVNPQGGGAVEEKLAWNIRWARASISTAAAFLASSLRTFGAGRFTVEGNCPAYCRVVSNIASFYPQGTSNTPFPAVTTENTHNIAACPLQKYPQHCCMSPTKKPQHCCTSPTKIPQHCCMSPTKIHPTLLHVP